MCVFKLRFVRKPKIVNKTKECEKFEFSIISCLYTNLKRQKGGRVFNFTFLLLTNFRIFINCKIISGVVKLNLEFYTFIAQLNINFK